MNSSGRGTVNQSGTRVVGALVAVAVLVALLVFGRSLAGELPEFARWVDGLGTWGPAVFVLGYAVATVAFVPGSALTLLGGAVFGLVWGTLYVFLGALAGTVLAFLAARYLARPWVERRVAGQPRFARLDEAVGEQGRKIVFLLRLSPVIPFNLLNYALGVTRVRLGDYVLASVGMIPGTVLYVYYGKVAGEVAALAGGAGVERGTGYYMVLALGLVATIAATVIVTRMARRALNQETENGHH
jgi:uncharacterized membrane protein YdjX (TVP38/TMEM64 family)